MVCVFAFAKFIAFIAKFIAKFIAFIAFIAKFIAFIAKFLDPAFITTQAYRGDNR